MYQKLLTEPSAFMKSSLRGRTLRKEAFVVTLIGLLGAIGPIYIGKQLLDQTETVPYLEFQIFGQIFQPVLIAFVAWFGYSMVAHLIANRLNSRSPFKRLLRPTAWALVPLGIGYLIRSVAIIVSAQLNPPEIEVQGAGGAEAIVREFMIVQVFAEPVVIVATVVLLGTLGWTGYLFAHAIEHAKELDSDTALKIAAVPVGIHAIVIIYDLIGLVMM